MINASFYRTPIQEEERRTQGYKAREPPDNRVAEYVFTDRSMSNESENVKQDSRREEQTRYKSMGFFDKYVPHSHVSNAVATICLVVVGMWGIRETRNALELSQRAWLSVVSVSLSAPVENKRSIRFLVFIVNSGHEPGKDVNVAIDNLTIDSFDSEITSMDDITIPYRRQCSVILAKPGKIVIAPNLTIGYSMDSVHGTPAFSADDKIISGTKFYIIRGCLAYNTFDELKDSAFCYVMRRATYNYVPLTQNGIQLPTPSALGPAGQPIIPATREYIFEPCATGFDSD